MSAAAAARSANPIVEYMPLVRAIARHLSEHLPLQVDIEDLEQEGVLGLMDAVKRFDPSQNVPFVSYAKFRIRGAIIDYLRSIDPLSRDTRRKVKQAESDFGKTISLDATTEHRDTALKESRIVADPKPLELENLMRAEESAAIDRAIAKLKPRWQEAVRLYYFEGLSMKEAGAQMGLNESRISQILRKVRETIKPDLEALRP
jgi:RNA polymerase sigma factor for flagellar operon FliA